MIGDIDQGDLADAIREAKAALAELRRVDLELTRIEDRDRENKGATIAPLEKAPAAAPDDSRDRSQGTQRQAERERESISANRSVERDRLERRFKISQLETRLQLDRDKFDRTSRITSATTGVVDQFLVAVHEQVQDGAPAVVLRAPRAQGGTAPSDPPYDAIVFVPADDAAMVEVGHAVEVVPATIKRESYGFIRGRVVWIDELPADKMTVQEALGNPVVADALLKRYAGKGLLRVKVKLLEENKARVGPNGIPGPSSDRFRWSKPHSAGQRFRTGTMCQAEIVVERRPLIRLILPWSRRLVGAD